MKILVLGNTCAGKTVFVRSICSMNKDVIRKTEPTIGVDYHKLENGTVIFDCSGNWKYRQLIIEHYMPCSDAIYIVYDSSMRNGSGGALEWFDLCKRNAPVGIPVAFVENRAAKARRERHSLPVPQETSNYYGTPSFVFTLSKPEGNGSYIVRETMKLGKTAKEFICTDNWIFNTNFEEGNAEMEVQ